MLKSCILDYFKMGRRNEGKLHIKVGGRVWEITCRAVRKYSREYNPTNGFDNECIKHIGKQFAKALDEGVQETKTDKFRRTHKVYRSPTMVFETISSMVVSMRINLRYSSRESGRDED
jgi:hypothetical protein